MPDEIAAAIAFPMQGYNAPASSPITACLPTTNHVAGTDIAAAPFLWVLPLAIYLLTFVAVFRETPWIAHANVVRDLAPTMIGKDADLVEARWRENWWRLHYGGRGGSVNTRTGGSVSGGRVTAGNVYAMVVNNSKVNPFFTVGAFVQ